MGGLLQKKMHNSRKSEISKQLKSPEKEKCFNNLDFKINQNEVAEAIKKVKSNRQ